MKVIMNHKIWDVKGEFMLSQKFGKFAGLCPKITEQDHFFPEDIVGRLFSFPKNFLGGNFLVLQPCQNKKIIG